MLYVLMCKDKPDSQALRLATRDAHLAYVGSNAGAIRLAGPMLSDDGESMLGSLFLIEAPDASAVRAFNADDPYTRAGLWGSVVIHPFRQVVPRE
ncbi:MAG: YciI family protein [Pseudomonadales bacterium]